MLYIKCPKNYWDPRNIPAGYLSTLLRMTLTPSSTMVKKSEWSCTADIRYFVYTAVSDWLLALEQTGQLNGIKKLPSELPQKVLNKNGVAINCLTKR